MTHRTVTHVMVIMARAMVHHRAIGATHSPAAEAAVGIDPRAIVTIVRAAEQQTHRRQYQNE